MHAEKAENVGDPLVTGVASDGALTAGVTHMTEARMSESTSKTWGNALRPSAPTGRERTFREDEIIVSKTDTTGRILYANDVFLRVAGYGEREIVGQPHSIIRHPDMPRVVFALLWETLAARRSSRTSSTSPATAITTGSSRTSPRPSAPMARSSATTRAVACRTVAPSRRSRRSTPSSSPPRAP
jgi:hypothetical protein